MDHSKRRRNVIKRLDFENCEVTTVRVRNIYRKRLKARTVSECEDEVSSTSESQVSSQNSCPQQEADVHTSPILFRKGSSQRKMSKTSSPVLIGKQKSAFRKRLKVQDEPQTSNSVVGEIANTTSPVFKLKTGPNRMKKTQKCKPDESKPSCAILTDDDCSADEFVIEDFSQEPQKEVSEECKISNFSSESKVCSQVNISEDHISEDQSGDTFSADDESFVYSTQTKGKDDTEAEQVYDSAKKRKRHKKGGLVEQLINLRKKLASERRIHEHKTKLMKSDEIWKRNLHVVEAWKDGTCLTLKCQQIEVPQDGNVTDFAATDFLYVILSRNIGSSYRKIKRGTFIRIAPPWQELRLHSLNATALLSVTFIELTDSVPGITIPKIGLRELSVTKYKEDEPLLFDTILASDTNVLLR